MTIIVDGLSFDVTPKRLTRKAIFLDKYAERTEDGELKRELIGVFYNYSLEINYTEDAAAYDAFWEQLVKPVDFHSVKFPTTAGYITIDVYIDASGVVDELIFSEEDGLTVAHHWQNLVINFIARIPVATP